MAIIKCKMCGGALDISEGLTVCECEYCGSKQTVPSADNEKMLTLFGRANRLRLANEFDKAAGVYESIVADFPEEAEAYWGLVLCRYGIEYVDDPTTGRKIPTCHRTSFESVMEDADFEQACENADGIARRQYRDEAKQIEEIRKGIIEVSGKEAPYDIFICYKETDENGDRTLDSVIAQDVYEALTGKGYRVFFSRISLEDKLGTEYEPYIFAALNSAKVMLAFGTDYEYYNAVWAKNEWSRFLKLMAADKSKHLIPCYKGIDAYDMPKEFAKLQAQDMGKVGAMQDLLRGIGKILPRKQEAATSQPVVQQVVQQVVQGGGPNVDALLKRGNMALEDHDWKGAKEYFDQVLNMDAECAKAYLGLAMATWNCHNWKAFAGAYVRPGSELYKDKNAERVRKFGDDEMRAWFDGLDVERAEQQRREAAERAERERKEATERIERLSPIRQRLAPVLQMIVAFGSHTVGLRSDGTVIAVGDTMYGHYNVNSWTDVVAIATGSLHTVGLKANGTVIATKVNKIGFCKYYGQCDVSGWTDVVAIAAGGSHTVGLKADGTVLAVGDNDEGQCNVCGWTDIVAIAAGYNHTVGLKADGTVVAVGQNYNGECDVGAWRDVVAIAAGFHTVGLKADGTVIAAGNNTHGQCNVGSWKDVVAIAAGSSHTVGLRADGTTVATKLIEIEDDELFEDNGQCDVSGWKNIVAIAAGSSHTVGLKADGTVVATKLIESEFAIDNGQCNVIGWKLFNSIDTIEQERMETGQQGKDAAKRAERLKMITPALRMIATGSHTVGLKADGTVIAVGDNKFGQCDVCGWTDVVAIAAGVTHTVGLKADGTVVAVGWNEYGLCDVGGWTDIVAIAAGWNHTVGLKADGTVIAVGKNNDGQCNVGGWKDIVAIAADMAHTVGLKADGTVIAVGNNRSDRCNVGDWKDIVAIAAGATHTVGLKVDGTVVAVGYHYYGAGDVRRWKDIVAITAGVDYTVGVKADGTVVAVGDNENGECDVCGWTDVVAIAAGDGHTVGLKADGTVTAVGKNEKGQCDVVGWKLFNSIGTIKKERIDALAAEQSSLQTELTNLKGLFTGKRRREIEARLAEIDAELNQLKG